MTNNEAKKLLYKVKPIANCFHKTPLTWIYDAIIDDIQIIFKVPVSDMGDLSFKDKEQAQLLIRYIDEIKYI